MRITDTIYDIVTWIYGDFVFVLLNLPQAGKLTYTAGVANVRNWNVSEVCGLRTWRPFRQKESFYRHCLPVPLSSSWLQSMSAAQWLEKVLVKLCNKKWKFFNTETFFFPVYHARRVERIYLSIRSVWYFVYWLLGLSLFGETRVLGGVELGLQTLWHRKDW